jgi:hypothetical protein
MSRIGSRHDLKGHHSEASAKTSRLCRHKDSPQDFLKTLSPMGTISTAEEVASAVVYLTESRQIIGEVLHVDGCAHNGKW